MIDTHSHLLPGLDDGSPDLRTSLKMAAEAMAVGTTIVVCTPHLREFDLSFVGRAQEEIQSLRTAMTEAGIELDLVLGFEVSLDVVATLGKKELEPLVIEGSGGALLIETPHWGWPVYAFETVFRLRTEGLLPVLAHPERNDRIQRTPDLLTKCLDAGAVAQGTAASLNGDFGRASKQALYRHLSRGDMSLIASDAHSHRRSSWTLAPAVAALRGMLSAEEADMLVRVNPGMVLTGGKPAAVMPSQRRPSWRMRTRRGW
jgi:protein-tyrosine phosphatase